jgi:hypothetical protein
MNLPDAVGRGGEQRGRKSQPIATVKDIRLEGPLKLKRPKMPPSELRKDEERHTAHHRSGRG